MFADQRIERVRAGHESDDDAQGEMPYRERVGAAYHSATLTRDALTRLTAFLISHLDGEPQLSERARRAVREMNALCELLEAKHPEPWIMVEADDLMM